MTQSPSAVEKCDPKINLGQVATLFFAAMKTELRTERGKRRCHEAQGLVTKKIFYKI